MHAAAADRGIQWAKASKQHPPRLRKKKREKNRRNRRRLNKGGETGFRGALESRRRRRRQTQKSIQEKKKQRKTGFETEEEGAAAEEEELRWTCVSNLWLDVASVDVIREEAGAGQPLPRPTAGHSHEADDHHQHRPCLSKVCDGHSWQNQPVGCFTATQLHVGMKFRCQQSHKVGGDTNHVY